jgi:hypothetical protein
VRVMDLCGASRVYITIVLFNFFGAVFFAVVQQAVLVFFCSVIDVFFFFGAGLLRLMPGVRS